MGLISNCNYILNRRTAFLLESSTRLYSSFIVKLFYFLASFAFINTNYSKGTLSIYLYFHLGVYDFGLQH